ncbi:ABC transporter substrate-binding protein [Mesorhizobium sp. M0306]|uniref:ABC transporter substrate-binding protein n=1 Tax=Mesorhizobium sp. M0306 TaxID=2956932 RepID=UPI0033396B5B
MNRRHFLTTLSTVAIAAPYVSRGAWAQSPGELRVQLYGGDVGRANIEAYVKPFEAETGVKVIPITDDATLPQLELMVTQSNVTLDVVALSPAASLVGAQKGYLEKIDYSIYKKEELDAIMDVAKQPYGVSGFVYSWVMFYNTEHFPANKPRPNSWAEFWDVEKFPGVRTLETGEYGVEGPWEEALLADGVNADALYPMDIDRVFTSLDKIKPHIRKWWTSGSEVQQMMREKAADIGNCYDGRAGVLIDEGAPLEISRNQAKLTTDYWGVVKGSPNADNAQKFIEFATRAKNQAAFAQLIAYGPVNRNAFKLIPEKRGRRLPTHPDNLASGIFLNMKWYSDIGSGGLSNADRLRERWNQWILL